jgi:hypothetical protein
MTAQEFPQRTLKDLSKKDKCKFIERRKIFLIEKAYWMAGVTSFSLGLCQPFPGTGDFKVLFKDDMLAFRLGSFKILGSLSFLTLCLKYRTVYQDPRL